jgi:hypothetical protein
MIRGTQRPLKGSARSGYRRRGIKFRANAAEFEQMILPTGNDKHDEYTRYAEHALAASTTPPGHESRIVLREMAAEWLRLANGLPSERPRLGL